MQSTLNSTYSKLALATVCAVSMGLTACQKPAEKTEGAAASQPDAGASTGKKFVLPLKARINHLTIPMPMAR